MNALTPSSWLVALVVLAAYLWGGVPSSYLVVRLKKGVDLRKTGSGNVGATNVMMHLGFKTGLLVGAFEAIGKATIPILLVRLFGLSLSVQVAVALAAIAGHNWSPYLKFTGGRGIATMAGAIIGLLAWSDFIVMLFFAILIGRIITKQFALWTTVALILMAPVSLLIRAPSEIIWFNIGAFGIIAAKRFTANWERPAKGVPLYKVFWYRFLYDRDIADHTQWITRGITNTYRPSTR
ncbi:MAG: hypothetical protein EXR67_02380 [Dehalococcoidia bacterium]|nr:hypothetical protein [Dehalococcoidia bacterium]